MDTCVFCKIRDKVIPKEFIYEDEETMVFPDIHPKKPIHLLVVAKKHIDDLLMVKDKGLTMKLLETIQSMIKKFGLSEKGYRLEVNGGGAQIVNHLHFHILGPMFKGGVL